jgi:hypothetical protein
MKRIVVIAFLVSCAESADELSPFPCANDKTCPAGLACVGDVCMDAQLDALCTTGDDPTNCAAAGPNAVCAVRPADRNAAIALGACEVPCAPGCPSGRACSSQGQGGMCLVDCTDDSACPPNTVCTPRNFDSRKVCVPPGVTVEECQSVQSPQACTSLCGSSLLNDVVCPNGTSTCPHGSTCSADSGFCMCGPGTQAVDCAGQACNGQCNASNWWCEPVAAAASCTSDRFTLSGACHCYDGRNINFACMSAMTCEDACEL